MPVMMGTAMAAGDGIAHIPSAVAALIGGCLIHTGCNLTNDYWDFKRGSNQAGEIDPMRRIPVGTVNQKNLKTACVLVFLLALIPCGYLVQRGGIPILLIAAASLLSAIFYTAGKNSLAYLGWGDIFAFIFFGPVALAGTYWVQSLEMNMGVLLAGFAPGLFAVAVLTINNIRDLAKDVQVNKKTLAVRFGKHFALQEYLAVTAAISLMPVIIYYLIRDHIYILSSSLIIFFAIPNIIRVLTAKEELAFNMSIGQTIKMLILYSMLFSIGWIF